MGSFGDRHWLSTLWETEQLMLGRHAGTVGMVEEDHDPPAQQKRWPEEKTF
jgi:hypothetical protein